MDVIVDVSYLSYRSGYAYHDLNYNGIHTGHVYGSIISLLTLYKEYSPVFEVNFVFAVDGNPKWRKEQHPEYKAGRVKTLGYDPRKDVIAILSFLPGKFIQNRDEEADDVIAAYVTRHSSSEKHKIIFSSDKDLWVLRDTPNLIILGNKLSKVSDADVENSFFTNKSSFVSLAKSIIGDELDNLPKVLRFPRKDLSCIFSYMQTPDVDDIFTTAKMLSDSGKISSRSYSLLLENESQIRKTYSLACLRRNIDYDERISTPNREALVNHLNHYGCPSLIPRIDSLFRRS